MISQKSMSFLTFGSGLSWEENTHFSTMCLSVFVLKINSLTCKNCKKFHWEELQTRNRLCWTWNSASAVTDSVMEDRGVANWTGNSQGGGVGNSGVIWKRITC